MIVKSTFFFTCTKPIFNKINMYFPHCTRSGNKGVSNNTYTKLPAFPCCFEGMSFVFTSYRICFHFYLPAKTFDSLNNHNVINAVIYQSKP